MTASETAERWLIHWGGRSDAPVRFFCLPYAGGNAAAYRQWSALAVRLDALLAAIELPGHGRRVGECAKIEISEVAEALASVIDRPYILFGHSLGARLGFEVCRYLRDRGHRLPLRLIVSGTPGPRLSRIGAGDSRLPDKEFIARVQAMGGTPAAILSDPELAELFLPTLRSDFAWGDAYQYRPAPLLTCPISAFAGAADPDAPASQVAEWQHETTGNFRFRVLPGNHFFLHSSADALFDGICADLPERPARCTRKLEPTGHTGPTVRGEGTGSWLTW